MRTAISVRCPSSRRGSRREDGHLDCCWFEQGTLREALIKPTNSKAASNKTQIPFGNDNKSIEAGLIRHSLELEAVAEFGVELAGVVVVEAAEGEAVVEEYSGVAYVQGVEGDGEALAEVLS
jgi:hypothetical protein